MADFTTINQEIDNNIKQNGVNAITGQKLNTVLKDMMSAVNTDKQDTIDDLAEIRTGAEAGAAAYQMPEEGIPSRDLSEGVQKSLENADNAVLYEEQSTKTDQQRNTALANVSNQTANSTTGKMGYKVLDPTKTFAEQVTEPNTIYEIRDVFDLGGTQETPVSVTLPAGSTLKFNGGVIKNCTLVNANIDAGRVKIFDTSVEFTNLINGEIYPEWFGAVSDGTTDCSAVFNKICKYTNKCVTLNSGTYLCSNTIDFVRSLSVFGIGEASIIRCNGIDLHENNTLKNLVVRSYDANTEYLVSIKSGNIGYGNANIIIDSVDLYGLESANNPITNGIYLCSDTNTARKGFYGVNVSNIRTTQRFNTSILFEVKGNLADYPWMTAINFSNCWLQGMNTCIDFVAPNDFNLTNNFGGITFDNVRAQYVSSYTDYFVKLGNCGFITFKSCCLFDAPPSNHFFIKKDAITGISVINYESSNRFSSLVTLDSNITQSVGYIIDRYFQNANTLSEYEYPTLKGRTFLTSDYPEKASAYVNIKALANETKGIYGIGVTNSALFSTTFMQGFIGFNYVDNKLCYSKPVPKNGELSANVIYGQKNMPYGFAFPSNVDGWGYIYYYTRIGGYLYWDNREEIKKWRDSNGVVITNNITSKFGTTSDREAMTMLADNEGFTYYDKTLKKWTMWNGTAWVNLDGTPLS